MELPIPTTFSPWYTTGDNLDTPSLAHDVWAEALKAFSSHLSKDKDKLKWNEETQQGNLKEVLACVFDARFHYESRKGDSKVRRSLIALSERIHHYGTIMDVVVQQHPEYTSLAWGAMKVLLVGVVNHQTLLYRLSEGLCQIADILPRAQLILQLYPTQQVKQTIVAMYAYILRFLIRALHWYQESKIMHMLHAITRPAELRYNDLLTTISSLSRSMTDLASASSHAEQRDIHTSIRKQIVSQDQIQTSLDDLKASVTQMRVEFSSQLVTSLGQVKVEFSQRLSEVQLHQFMDHLSVTFLLDPDKAFQASYCMGKRRRLMSSTSCPEFWLEPKMQIWNRCCESSLIIIKGTRKMRFQLRDFCTDSIATLLDTKVPVIWALKTIATQENTRDHVSTIDLLKYMISQAIRVNKAIQTDATLAPHLGSYLGARTEEEWFNVFASVLQGIPLVYIILDVDVLNLSAEEPTKDVWSTEFLRIFSELQARNSKTVVRVALVDYSSPLLRRSTTTERHDLVVSVGGMRQAKAPTRLPYRRGGASMRGRTLGLGRQAGATQTCHGAGRLKRG